MNATRWTAAILTAGFLAAGQLGANGGPFVVKYPTGDPAAKGVLARLDPSLRPTKEARLRVEREDLTIAFTEDRFATAAFPVDRFGWQKQPLAHVTAYYVIENPTDKAVSMDFGFPILRGIYISPMSMMPTPEARVQVVDLAAAPAVEQVQAAKAPKVPAVKAAPAYIRPQIISNSTIYGLIRRQAREVIDKGVAADAKLARLVDHVRVACGVTAGQAVADRQAPRKALAEHMTGALKWNVRDAALMVEYASVQLGMQRSRPFDATLIDFWASDDKLLYENLGPLSAIGEQKATQFLAVLAGRFDAKAAAAYEEIFSAWGGDVTERSVDLTTGKVRPREISVPPEGLSHVRRFGEVFDPTVYARVDYLDPQAKITAEEKASCQAVLKNLPVVFTFAPMNLLHYQVEFAPKSKKAVIVTYSQHAYADTKDPASYQLAYVLHPASLWEHFGPINLKVLLPAGVACKASVTLSSPTAAPAAAAAPFGSAKPVAYVAYAATITEPADKTGELFIGLDKAAWDRQFAAPKPKPASPVAPVVSGAKLPAK